MDSSQGELRHFVAYHNSDEFGPYYGDASKRKIREGEEHSFVTAKSFREETLKGQRLWAIEGAGSPRRYRLISSGLINRIAKWKRPRSYRKRGREYGLRVHFKVDAARDIVDLTDFSWFRQLLQQQQSFRNGLNRITDTRVIRALAEIGRGDISTGWRTARKNKEVKALPQRRSSEAASESLHTFIPQKNWVEVLKVLANSIQVADRATRDKWGIRVNRRSVMLKVGFVEVLQLGQGSFHLLVDKKLVTAKLRSNQAVQFDDSEYLNAPGCGTCDMNIGTLLRVYESLRPAHVSAIRVKAFGTLRDGIDGQVRSFGGRLDGGIKAIDDRAAAIAAKLNDDMVRMRTEANANRESLRTAIDQRLDQSVRQQAEASKTLRDELSGNFDRLGARVANSMTEASQIQKERLENVTVALTSLTEKLEKALQDVRATLEAGLEKMRGDNAEKLEQIRVTVDEKLQGTLEHRLGASFKLVSEQLEQVFRSVGEMRTLASGVGDLKRVLSSVKLRGNWGEISLGGMLEQVMAPDQYDRNVEIKPGSNQRVEYAVKLPGAGDSEGPIWLPIDAKFPTEDYERLVDASERGNLEAVELASKALEMRIRVAAKDICDKYVRPPHSTDFGILFLPTEGLFAEIIRRPGLIDTLQRDCRVVVTGPTTLLALLNSLRMGFRTLAIQKRSSEVWQILAAVKTEFGEYGKVLDKVQKKLQEATNTIDAVAVRRRAIDRKLRTVEVMPELEAKALLGLTTAENDNPMAGQRPAAE